MSVFEDEVSVEVCVFISVTTEIDIVIAVSTAADTATGYLVIISGLLMKFFFTLICRW